MRDFSSYLDWIDSQYSQTVLLVEKWASINSWSHNIQGLEILASQIEKDFRILNGSITKISLAPHIQVDSKGNQIQTALGKAISIKKRPEAPLQVLLAGHMDTVYSPSHPFQRVVKHNEIIRGPGVADMKGGLAIMLKAIEAFERAPFAQNVGWEILINPDEEIGSPGSQKLFVDAAKRSHYGLIFEPSFSDGAFVNQRKGSANFTLIAKGKSAHAGRDFHAGRNAIYAMSHFLYELEKLISSETTINVGHIQGGEAVNIVPDLCLCRFNLRSQSAESMERVKNQIEELLGKKREGIEFILVQDSFRLPKIFDSKTEKLFEEFRTCAHELNLRFEYRESGGVCDGNILAAEGLPTIDSLGPIGGDIHTAQEYLVLSSLTSKTKLAALFLLRLSDKGTGDNKDQD